ncbi:hypothetical protein M3221_16405 [Domibacillus indicus]|uniref:hypothetical protein n=1 Tax=Domibacillus indicus TaxID=1437523 RepID=UPI00203EC414|nr:hypothetical protein [Domibacillus indicus]MCM3789972.1 hypothetical protein [Domibacillus indicus]
MGRPALIAAILPQKGQRSRIPALFFSLHSRSGTDAQRFGDWCFIIPGSDDTFSYMEGIYTHNLTPDYSIEMGKRSTKPGYAVLNLPAIYSLTYQAMDLLYQQVPVANLYMERLKTDGSFI